MLSKKEADVRLVSRRCLLRSAAAAAGGVAVFTAGVREPAEAKALPKLVAYQATPHGPQECDNCAQFVAPNSCKVVDGVVSPTGWCKVYIKKIA